MSLKQRLLLLVLGAVTLVWIGVATFVYYGTQHELDEVWAHYSEQVESVFEHDQQDSEDDDEDSDAELLELRNGLAGKVTPLTVAVPREVIPLIERLNHLFARTGKLIENERRFTADAAHELRTPIAGIKAQVQVAQGASDAAGRNHALDNAIQGCNRATHLIGQLLTLARLESADTANLQSCPLRALAVEVMAELAPKALESGVRLALLDGEEIIVQGLPALLQVMLRNLLDNAVRYTPAGTLVQVGITHAQGKPCICISDNGAGLPAEELAKITQRFYRPLGTSASGSGLGLSIVQRIAEIHQATVQIGTGSDGLGLGVTVTFLLR